MRSAAVVVVIVATVATSVPTARASDASVRGAFIRGIADIQAAAGPKRLEPRLERTLSRLRRVHASTETGRRARVLAVRGFAATLNGVRAQLALVANDSGNIEAAVRDAIRGDRYLDAGAKQLRAAGRVLGIRIGKLNGH